MSYDPRWDNSIVNVTTAITPSINDAAWQNAGSVNIGTQGADFTITGIVAPATNTVDILTDGANDGKTTRPPMILFNDSGHNMTLNHQDAASSVANRIITGSGGGNLTIANGGNVTITYDAFATRWRVIAKMP